MAKKVKYSKEELEARKKELEKQRAELLAAVEADRERLTELAGKTAFYGYDLIDGFNRYDLDNVLLLLLQQERAGVPLGEPVASFRAWIGAGRGVRRGSTSMQVSNGRGGFTYVFSFSQTDLAHHGTLKDLRACGVGLDGGRMAEPVKPVKEEKKRVVKKTGKGKEKPVSKSGLVNDAGQDVSGAGLPSDWVRLDTDKNGDAVEPWTLKI